MKKGNIKRVFPGGNTPLGFFSYYDYIIPPDAQRIFVIKGGPGVGKSTFMKKIGEAMVERGYDAEYHHCSSDNNSLDGVVICDLKIAFIDGTAPHIVDPKNPGCVDEIINFGEYWDLNGVIQNKQKILEANKEVGRLFRSAYYMLQAAKSVYIHWESINTEAMSFAEANHKTLEIIENIFANTSSIGSGKLRKLFGSAITPEGPVNYLSSIISTMPRKYIIAGDPGTGRATLLDKIVNTALAKGFDVEAYYCPFSPDKVEHVVIPALETALTTSFPPHVYTDSNTSPVWNMNECLKPEVLNRLSSEIAASKQTFEDLLAKAVSFISQAKAIHDLMETYYVPNMDFNGIQKLWEHTLNRVLACTQK